MFEAIFRSIQSAIQEILNTSFQPIKAGWQLIPDSLRVPVEQNTRAYLNGLTFTLPTVAPPNQSLEYAELPKGHINRVINSFAGENSLYVLRGLFYLSLLDALQKQIPLDKNLRLLSTFFTQSMMWRQFLTLWTSNTIYFMNLSSLANKVSPSLALELCQHDDEAFLKSLLKGTFNGVTAMLFAFMPTILIQALEALKLISPTVSRLLQIPFTAYTALLYGQSIMNNYLAHARLCTDCRYEWFSKHNAFCFGIGTTLIGTHAVILSPLRALSLSNWIVEDGVFNLLWGFAILNTQFKTLRFNRRSLAREPFVVDVTLPIRQSIDYHLEHRLPEIIKLLNSNEEGPFYHFIMRHYDSLWMTSLRLCFIPEILRSKHAFSQISSVQALLLEYQPDAKQTLNYLGIFQKIYGTPVYGFLKVSGILNVKQKLPQDIYNPLRKLLIANFFNDKLIKELKALMISAHLHPSLKVEWAKVYQQLAQYAHPKKSPKLTSTPLLNAPLYKEIQDKAPKRFNAPITKEELEALSQHTRKTVAENNNMRYITQHDPLARNRAYRLLEPTTSEQNNLRDRPNAKVTFASL